MSTRLSLNMSNEEAGAGRDSRSRLARPNSYARTGRGNINFPCPADHDTYIHTYILTSGTASGYPQQQQHYYSTRAHEAISHKP